MHRGDVSNRLNAAQIAELFAITDSGLDATESERIEAVKSLLHEYRLQIAEYRRDERSVIDPLLLQGIGNWGRRIFADATPVLVLERFLGERLKPGKRAKHRERNLALLLQWSAKCELA
jgi:hypothetical protein